MSQGYEQLPESREVMLYAVRLDEQGQVVEEQETYTVESVSKARRIRYSRHFFHEKVADLRARLFADLEQEAMEQTTSKAPADCEPACKADQADTSKSGEDEPRPAKRSSWSRCACIAENAAVYRIFVFMISGTVRLLCC